MTDAPEKRIVIPISGPRAGEPSEPPGTPRSAGSRAPGEKQPPAGGPRPPEPTKASEAKPAKQDMVARVPEDRESPEDREAPDEFDDLLMSLRAALEEGEEAVVEDEPAEPSVRGENEDDVVVAPEAFDDPTFPDWLGGFDSGGKEMKPQAPRARPGFEIPAEAFRPPPPESPPRRRYVYRSYESSRVNAHKLACRVTLSSAGREYSGVAEGAAIPGVRADIAARATLNAVANAEKGAVVLSLIAARVLRFVDLPLVVVSVYGVNGDEVKRLVGAAPVDNSEEQAAVLATLQATDRWLAAAALGY